ncbi:MAG: AAA family ATPase [Treponema sp.]|nr:AAA family ATPase [Candidatus Treponema equifaecale]
MYSEARSSIASEESEKKLVGRDLSDCKAQLFNQFGQNYRITGQRQIFKAGFLGFGQKEMYEVKYIVNSKPVAPVESFQKSRDEFIQKTGASVTNTLQLANIDKRIEELTKNLDQKLKEIADNTSASDKPLSIQKIEELLQDNEFTFKYINQISTRLRAELTLEELDDFDLVQKTVVDWIGESIKIAPNIPHKYPHVIILVGPTGVGKTTTIAKLAGTMIKEAQAKGEPKPRIRMITIDRTRVGAEDQLRRYGDIMNIDVDKAESADDVKEIFNNYKENLDVFFIDTPGYSPNDFENIGKMRQTLEVQGIHPDVYLTVTATAKAKDLVSIIQNYETFNFNSVIVTKWDETTAVGNVVSVLSEKGKSVSYITDGQQVPRKIERAKVVKFLTNLVDFKIDRLHIDDKFPEDK